MDALLAAGAYADHAELIQAAISQLLFIQQAVGSKGAVFFDDMEPGTRQAESLRPSETHLNVRDEVQAPRAPSNMTARPVLDIPEIFRVEDGLPTPDVSGTPLTETWTQEERVPLDHWLWGQYNRFLPAKATCRALRSLQASPLPLERAREVICDEAVALGDRLVQIDEQKDAHRFEAFATAFPVSGKGVEKSKDRFANQFVARQSKSGDLHGLPVELGLVGLGGADGDGLLLTRAGWDFASLPNPVLNGAVPGNLEKLTEEERSFLLRHIGALVPREASAYRTILEGVSSGAQTPDGLDEYLSANACQGKVSPSFLSTQRSGAVSRMTDLGLLDRIRDGIRVRYVATPIGHHFVEGAEV